MNWYWLLLVVFILGIGVFVWVFRRSRYLKIDMDRYDIELATDSDDAQTRPIKDAPAEPLDIEPSPPKRPPTMVGSTPKPDLVEFGAFVPRDILPGSSFLLDIWAYLPHDYDMVCSIARKLSQDINVGRKIGIPVSRGTFLTIMIDIPALIVDDPIDSLIWEGQPANTSYTVKVPLNVRNGSYPGKAVISSDGIPIAKLSFLISIASIVNAEVVDSTVERKFINTAFASYSKQNREEVFARIQGMKKVAPDLDIFVDVLSLRSGDDWQEKLNNHVPFKDTFFLFWSKDAAESEWVEREWRLALNKRGLNYIDPVPLVDPDLVQPPPELNAKHFTDAYILHIEYERFKRKSLEK